MSSHTFDILADALHLTWSVWATQTSSDRTLNIASWITPATWMDGSKRWDWPNAPTWRWSFTTGDPDWVCTGPVVIPSVSAPLCTWKVWSTLRSRGMFSLTWHAMPFNCSALKLERRWWWRKISLWNVFFHWPSSGNCLMVRWSNTVLRSNSLSGDDRLWHGQGKSPSKGRVLRMWQKLFAPTLHGWAEAQCPNCSLRLILDSSRLVVWRQCAAGPTSRWSQFLAYISSKKTRQEKLGKRSQPFWRASKQQSCELSFRLPWHHMKKHFTFLAQNIYHENHYLDVAFRR